MQSTSQDTRIFTKQDKDLKDLIAALLVAHQTNHQQCACVISLNDSSKAKEQLVMLELGGNGSFGSSICKFFFTLSFDEIDKDTIGIKVLQIGVASKELYKYVYLGSQHLELAAYKDICNKLADHLANRLHFKNYKLVIKL